MPEGRRARWAAARALLPAVALAAALLTGALLRAAGGGALFSSSLVFSAPRKQAAPGSGSPADVVRSFYILLDRGDYEAAWALAREPDYIGSGNAPYRSEVAAAEGARPAWTPRQAFVSRLNDELGYSGEWLRLTDVQAEEVTAAQAGDGPEAVAAVRAQGTLLGACTIFRWEKVLPVTRAGGRYRVLLPGTKQANALFYQEWFANVRKIGTLRAVAP
jgi:hypothetical protein